MKFVIGVVRFLLNIIYGIIKLFIHPKDKVLLISRQSNEIPLDFCLLIKRFEEKASDWQVVPLCKTLKKSIPGMLSYSFHIFRQMYHLANAKAVVLDSYSIAVSLLNHRKSLTVIQMWHSMGTMKKFGYQILDMDEGSGRKLALAMRMHHNYDYIFASSSAYSDYLADGFGYPHDKVSIQPLPRLDLLRDKEYAQNKKNALMEEFDLKEGKRNILYCPTFRKNEDDSQIAIDELIACIDYDRYNLIIKLHPLSKLTIQNSNVIIPKDHSTFDMLFAADYVISDYSCVVYEASVLDIPLYFYAFDLADYTGARGLTLDYAKEVPGPILADAKEIIKAIESEEYDIDKLKKFSEKYIVRQDDASGHIVDLIVSEK